MPKLLPAYFLKANEDKAFWSNIITSLEYTVDVVTTLSGVGNIAKFRHLANVAKVASRFSKYQKASKFASTISKIRLAAGAIEISSGSLNILLKLTELRETPFGQALTEYLFYLELLSLSGELTAAIKNGLRKSAKILVKHEDEIRKQLDEVVIEDGNSTRKLSEADKEKFFDELYEVAEISFLNRGRLAGQILDEAAVAKIKSFLSKNKVELQIGNQKGVFEVDGYFYPSGKTVIMEPHNAAMFITDGLKMKMVLRENATVLEFLHEFMHFNHCKSLGIKNYYNLKGVDGLITRERFVFDKLMEHKEYLNRRELIDAKEYMNKYYKKNGITDNAGNPIIADFNFDIKIIPKKRQEVNIDKLLNLK